MQGVVTMKRDLAKLIEQTTIDPSKEIRASEIQQLLDEYSWSNDITCLINRAFTFGYAIGQNNKS